MKNKKIIIESIMATLILSACGSQNANSNTETTITGSSKGFGGMVDVTITFDGDKITKVTSEGKDETPTVGGAALEKLDAELLEKGSADIDGVSGATFTSDAYKKAAQQAIDEHNGKSTSAEIKDISGTYEGTASGYGGDVTVSVELNQGQITDIVVTDAKETYGIGQHALDELPSQIVDTQNVAVDSISGATISSNAVKTAVSNALETAGEDVSAYEKKVEHEKESETAIEMNTDILVVGGGMGGLAAALYGNEAGLDVLLLERLGFVGGESAMTGGEVLVSGSTFQKEQGVEDTPEKMEESIGRVGHAQQLDRLTKVFAENIGTAFDGVEEAAGLEPDELITEPGDETARQWQCDGERGSYITEPLATALLNKGVKIQCNTEVYALNTDENGVVIGANARDTKSGQEYIIQAKAVILATGGFGGNDDLKEQYNVQALFSAPLQVAPGIGHEMALSLGADTYRMDMVCNRPGGMMGDDGLAYNCNNGLAAIRVDESVGYIAVNKDGKRYAPELTEDEVGLSFQAAMLVTDENALSVNEVNEIGGTSYVILDEAGFDVWRANSKSIPDSLIESWLASNGTGKAGLTTGNTIEECAEAMGLDGATVAETLKTYNENAKQGTDPEFNSSKVIALSEEGPYYMIANKNRYNSNMGGLLASDEMEILNADGNVISGLYGAGSIIGGHQGDTYIGGGMIGWGMTSGMLAAQAAATYASAE